MAVTRGKPMQAGEDKRRARGFKPGQSGNPGGRPKALKEVEELCRKLTPQAIERLEKILTDDDAPAAAHTKAVEIILDRGWGKAKQSVELTGENGGPVGIEVIRRVIVDPNDRDP